MRVSHVAEIIGTVAFSYYALRSAILTVRSVISKKRYARENLWGNPEELREKLAAQLAKVPNE